MVSTEKVEKVVNEPINPVPINKVNSTLIDFFIVITVRIQLSKKQPKRFINKVPSGNPLAGCIHSPILYLDIAPKNPPSITDNSFNRFSLLSNEDNALNPL
jgi:hypothetical protein